MEKVRNNGITLIALVITIIVLLILAAVSIATLTGENGILTKATEAKEETNIEKLKEQVKTDILGYQIENENGKITGEQLQNVLKKYFTNVPETVKELEQALEDDNFILKANEDYGGENVEVKLSEIYKWKSADEVTSYVGCYADLDGEGTPDGIIYADLAITTKGQWNNRIYNDYSYEARSGFKSYKIWDSRVQSAKFGNKEMQMITETKGTTGENRFYVMALEDLDNNYHYWYYTAYDNESLDNPVSGLKNDFGDGKENTKIMLEKYADEAYGEPKTDGTYTDLWGLSILKEKVAEGWFVPSKAEWAAFGDMVYTKFGINTSNYNTLGIRGDYWSSSQQHEKGAWSSRFTEGQCGRKCC